MFHLKRFIDFNLISTIDHLYLIFDFETIKSFIYFTIIYIYTLINIIDIHFLPYLEYNRLLAPKVWLQALKGKGLEISGTYSRKNATIFMELTLTNNAMQSMSGFAIQLNKNRYSILLIVINTFRTNEWVFITHLLNINTWNAINKCIKI